MTGLVISLTTTPPRLPLIGHTLRDLLAQRAPVDEIRLNLPRRYRRFEFDASDVPDLPKGVRLTWVDEDLGPATKVLPTVADLAGQDVEILFCDDDQPYDPDWAGRFVAARATHPGACIVEKGYDLETRRSGYRYFPARDYSPRALRRHKGVGYRLFRAATLTLIKPPQYVADGYVDVLEGYRGVMVRPEFIPPEAFSIPDILWTVDDPWLSGHMTRIGVPIWLNAASRKFGRPYAAHHQQRLGAFSYRGYDRLHADTLCFEYFRRTYGIWPDRLPQDNTEAATWPLPQVA